MSATKRWCAALAMAALGQLGQAQILVGQTAGSQDVEIRARVEGFLETMNFQEGTPVRQGALLYTIDRKPLEAILSQAKADQATAEARLAKANNDVARYTPLAAKQAVSQQELRQDVPVHVAGIVTLYEEATGGQILVL